MVGVRNAQARTHTAWQFHPGDYLVVAIFICTTVVSRIWILSDVVEQRLAETPELYVVTEVDGVVVVGFR